MSGRPTIRLVVPLGVPPRVTGADIYRMTAPGVERHRRRRTVQRQLTIGQRLVGFAEASLAILSLLVLGYLLVVSDPVDHPPLDSAWPPPPNAAGVPMAPGGWR